MYYFRYPVAGGGPEDYLPVATTRPETIPGDTAVAVHPEDPRFQHLIGRRCAVPMSDRCERLPGPGARNFKSWKENFIKRTKSFLKTILGLKQRWTDAAVRVAHGRQVRGVAPAGAWGLGF